MIKHIIFDIGNVLLSFKPDVFLGQLFSDDVVCWELKKVIFETSEWLELDKGTITEEEATEIFVKRFPKYRKEIETAMNSWTDMLMPIDANVKLLSELKSKGFKLYYLSNFHKKAFEQQLEVHNFFSLFDGGIVSAYVNQLKPGAAIYHTLINEYDLVPNNCLFIDDTKDNIDIAKNLGLNGIHLTDNMDLKMKVNELL